MRIDISAFGQIKGEAVSLFTLTNSSGASASVTNFGGAITRLCVKDKKGRLDNVALGFDRLRCYTDNPGYLGVLIGPVCNRIAGGRFTFMDTEYAITPNENGKSLLHGGDNGFHDKVYAAACSVENDKATLTLTREFPHVPGGHPGSLNVCVKYTFTENDEFMIDYDITSDSPSFVSPTNHAYFSLGGTSAKKVPTSTRQYISIYADRYTQIDADTISVGHAPVDGTPFDLRAPALISKGLEHEAENEQLKNGFGYDHNFLLSGDIDPETGLRLAAKLYDPRTGREMSVLTDMPAVQFYNANHLKRYNPDERRYYTPRTAVCLETQFTPDSIHHVGEDGYQLGYVAPDKPFHSRTVYAFTAKK